MSADQQRLNSAIQQIAERSPRVRGLLEANENKGGKAGAVGIGVSEAEETRICCDGSTSDNANPGTTENDPDGDGSGQGGGLDGDDPALLDNGAGELSGVTDCATGEPICVSGIGFIPPDDWDSPSDPPVDPEYIEGSWFDDLNGGIYQTPRPAAIARYESLGTGSNATLIEYYRNSGLEWRVRYLNNDNGLIYNTAFFERLCSSSYRSICDEPPPTINEWPADGCTNLAIVNGSIVGSKYDPENDGSYSAPVQELEVCDAVSGDRILLRVDTNSTYKSIKSLDGDIDPDTQAGYLYETGTGRRIRQISPSEFRDPTV